MASALKSFFKKITKKSSSEKLDNKQNFNNINPDTPRNPSDFTPSKYYVAKIKPANKDTLDASPFKYDIL